MRLSKGTSTIYSVDDWFKLAPPKGRERQWKDGRSAKELARAWCGGLNGPCAPPEFLELLSSLVTADQFDRAEGWPEQQVSIDDVAGEPPNVDLALITDGVLGRTVICVEAKADEPFGKDALEILNSAVVRIARDERTGAIERLQNLATRLLPDWEVGLPHLADIRYQLLTGTAATLQFAHSQEAGVAIFVIHEFWVLPGVDEGKQRRNAHDLGQFIRRLTRGARNSLTSGEIVGPIAPPSQADWRGISLYIGKVTSSR